MSTHEFTYWRAFYKEKARLEEEAQKESKKKTSGPANQEFKKTMGSHRQ